jgi:hypothetical protein
MFANNRLLSVASGRMTVPVPRARQPVRPTELAQWPRAYIGVPIDVAAKLLVLGVVLSFAVRATTHEGYRGVDHDNGRAVHAGQVTHP